MANSLLAAGRPSRGRWAAVLVVAALACGCGRQEKTAATRRTELTPEQEAAAREYGKLLDEQIQRVEETAAILATVQADAASRTAARDKLLALSVHMEVLQKRLLKEQPADPQVALTAKARIQQRLETAYGKLQAQVARINDLPGGRDFFEKDLAGAARHHRPLSAAPRE